MDRSKAQAQLQEAVTALYLRLNGCFVSGYIAHSPAHGKNLAEVDVLAIRLAHNAEPGREIGTDPLLRLTKKYHDLCICEVKSRGQALRFNPSLTGSMRAIASVIRWVGFFSEDQVQDLAPKVQKAFREREACIDGPVTVVESGVRIRGLLFSLERNRRYRNWPWFVTGDDVLTYVHRCLSPGKPRSDCSIRYDLGLWGDYAQLVEYFKQRPAGEPGDMGAVYRSLLPNNQ